MTADEQDFCPCGCRVIWSTKHQMTLCLGCDIGREPHGWKKAVGQESRPTTRCATVGASHQD